MIPQLTNTSCELWLWISLICIPTTLAVLVFFTRSLILWLCERSQTPAGDSADDGGVNSNGVRLKEDRQQSKLWKSSA